MPQGQSADCPVRDERPPRTAGGMTLFQSRRGSNARLASLTQVVTGFNNIYRLQLVDLTEHFSIDNLTLTASAIPEPISAAWLGLGAVALGWMRWRRASPAAKVCRRS